MRYSLGGDLSTVPVKRVSVYSEYEVLTFLIKLKELFSILLGLSKVLSNLLQIPSLFIYYINPVKFRPL